MPDTLFGAHGRGGHAGAAGAGRGGRPPGAARYPRAASTARPRSTRPSRSFADRLMFWRPTPPAGTAVDPVRESQRLRQNAALGQSTETGDTPIIQRRRAGLFSGLF